MFTICVLCKSFDEKKMFYILVFLKTYDFFARFGCKNAQTNQEAFKMRGDSRSRTKKRKKKSYHEELCMPNAANTNVIAGRDGGQDIPIQSLEMPEPDGVEFETETGFLQADERLIRDRSLVDATMPKRSKFTTGLRARLPRKIKSLLRGTTSDKPSNRLKLPKT